MPKTRAVFRLITNSKELARSIGWSAPQNIRHLFVKKPAGDIMYGVRNRSNFELLEGRS